MGYDEHGSMESHRAIDDDDIRGPGLVYVVELAPSIATYAARVAAEAILLNVIRESITLCEWLGHISLNVQILNDSALTIYIVMLVESRASNEAITPVPLHALEPGYLHLNSIPQSEPSAHVTMTLSESDGNNTA